MSITKASPATEFLEPANISQHPWPEEKRKVAQDVLESGNPRVIDFGKYRFPEEDPVDMTFLDDVT